MNFLKDLKEKVLVYDGSKGYMLQLEGLEAGHCPEEWNIQKPEKVQELYRKYIAAGCDVIQTNTFSGNRIQLEKHGLADKLYDINYMGVKLAKDIAGDCYVAASVGPTGTLMEPSGDLSFEKAYEIFKEQVKALVDGGVDIINFETFSDISEMRAALIASKEVCDKPVICSMSFEQNMRTLMGTTPFACGKILLNLGADVIGTNCSFGPEHMDVLVKELALTGEPVSVKPNAGVPRVKDGKTVYEQEAQEFCDIVCDFTQLNGHLIGGCCGTTPEFMRLIKENIIVKKYEGEIDTSNYLISLTQKVDLASEYKVGELEFTDKSDIYDIVDDAYDVAYEDYQVIELIYKGDDVDMLKNVIVEIQTAVKQPIIINSKNNLAVEKALLIYSGTAGVRNKVEAMYGAVCV